MARLKICTVLLVIFSLLIAVATAREVEDTQKAVEQEAKMKGKDMKSKDFKMELIQKYGAGLYAVLETSKGTITCRLFPDKAPKTVKNFVGLATGNKEWIDPKTGKATTERFYDGLTFHRVIPEFMIQTGCPLGTGKSGPGYYIEDEFNESLKFAKPGMLGMANISKPDTNGSQFFITEKPTPWLNNKHTIFGEVVDGLDVVKEIARVPSVPRINKPKNPVTLKKVTIIEAYTGGKKPGEKPAEEKAEKKKSAPGK